jgi:hypothetical protein
LSENVTSSTSAGKSRFDKKQTSSTESVQDAKKDTEKEAKRTIENVTKSTSAGEHRPDKKSRQTSSNDKESSTSRKRSHSSEADQPKRVSRDPTVAGRALKALKRPRPPFKQMTEEDNARDFDFCFE